MNTNIWTTLFLVLCVISASLPILYYRSLLRFKSRWCTAVMIIATTCVFILSVILGRYLV